MIKMVSLKIQIYEIKYKSNEVNLNYYHKNQKGKWLPQSKEKRNKNFLFFFSFFNKDIVYVFLKRTQIKQYLIKMLILQENQYMKMRFKPLSNLIN